MNAQKLFSYLSQEESTDFFSKCRELAFNFEWVFVTLNMISPPIVEDGPRLSYLSLNSLIAVDAGKPSPLYVVDLKTFQKVLKQLDLKLSYDEICQIGEISESLKQENFPELKPLNYDGKFLIYDRFLLTLRNAVLDPEEIKIVTQNYRKNRNNIEPEDELAENQMLEEESKLPKLTFEPPKKCQR